jgi:hypothetical protein
MTAKPSTETMMLKDKWAHATIIPGSAMVDAKKLEIGARNGKTTNTHNPLKIVFATAARRAFFFKPKLASSAVVVLPRLAPNYWVISRQTIPNQNPPLSALVQ